LVMSLLMIALAIEPSRVLLIPKITEMYALPAVLCFAFGMIFYTNRERIPLHGFGVVLMIGLIIVTGHAQPPGNIFVCAAISYTTAWFAFHPRLRVKIPPRIGDISYGLYVYAFPIQQTVIYRSGYRAVDTIRSGVFNHGSRGMDFMALDRETGARFERYARQCAIAANKSLKTIRRPDHLAADFVSVRQAARRFKVTSGALSWRC
jgi:hypothetical protein